MIKITKSKDPPKILITDGIKEKAANNALYNENPSIYKSGGRKLKIKKSIYKHKTVKQQLIADQFGKCCFCEADFTANGYGDVEHFRPKAGYRQHRNDEIKKPGYYWKAYDWDNLFFSCQICNRTYKKNYFPLANEKKRALSHHDDIKDESPLLIHPSQDTPESHIGFKGEVCIPKDDKGKKSISAYGLNREKLRLQRWEHLEHVDYYHSIVELEKMNSSEKKSLLSHFKVTEDELIVNKLKNLIEKARQFLNMAAKANSKFAGMVRHKYPKLPQ
jgi:uncharacterized protein (TIGR02646 family)